MLFFSNGIAITNSEYRCLLHIAIDPEQSLRDTVVAKAQWCRDKLITEWLPKFRADASISTLPVDTNALVQLIMARPDYLTLGQKEERIFAKELLLFDPEHIPVQVPPTLRPLWNVGRFNARPAVTASEQVTLFPQGVEIADNDNACILAYAQNIDDWVLGALLGHINRGKKKMIAQYQPLLMADPNVATLPADEDGLIQTITARADYKTLPEQAEALRLAQAQTGRNLA